MVPNKDDLLPYLNNRKEAAKKYGVTEKTVTNWLKKYDLYKPKENYGCNKLNMEKAIEIRKLKQAGTSIKDLACKYKVTFATISRIINNLVYVDPHSTAMINVVYNVNKFSETKSKEKVE